MSIKSKTSPSKRKVVDAKDESSPKSKKTKLENNEKFIKKNIANKDFKSAAAVPEGSTEKADWTQIKKDRKELRLKRREKDCESSEIFQLSSEAKRIWEQVRRQDCKQEKKDLLCTELYALIKGKAKNLIYAHDTVRVIETLVGVSNDEIRTQLFDELKDDILNLSKNKYSRFFIIKVLRSGNKKQKNEIIKAMMGHIVGLMKHKIASDVVELAYNDYANMKQRSEMIQEFYGPRFRVFKDEINNLKEAIAKYPNNKKQILKEIRDTLTPIIEKGVFTNTMIHTLMKEYLYACDMDDKAAIIDSIKEAMLPIIHTRDGARVAMICLWFGTTRQKKVILKSFKGNLVKIAVEEHGYMVLLAALDTTDDTVFIRKAILPELYAELDQLAESESGRKVLRYLVSPRDKTFFHPDVLKVLKGGDDSPTSKKDLHKKFEELYVGDNNISDHILGSILKHIGVFAKNSHWTLFVGAALKNLKGPGVAPIYTAIAEICADPFIPGMDSHFLEISHINKMVSFLIQCDKKKFENGEPTFSETLVQVAEDEMRGWSITNRGCFILVKLFETEIPDIVEKLREVCLPLQKKLKTLSFTGAEILLKKL